MCYKNEEKKTSKPICIKMLKIIIIVIVQKKETRLGWDMRQSFKQYVMWMCKIITQSITLRWWHHIIVLWYFILYNIKRWSLLYHNGDGIEMFRKPQCALGNKILTPNWIQNAMLFNMTYENWYILLAMILGIQNCNVQQLH